MRVGSKILITGGSGMLGGSLYFLWRDCFDLHLVSLEKPVFTNKQIYLVDLTNREEVKRLTKTIEPNIIVHTAALTNVDFCEDNPEQAEKVNIGATANLAVAAKEVKSKFVYISTDFVFDGEKGDYKEDDFANPISVYGKTKLEGEKITESSGLNFIIGRTAIYGWNTLLKESMVEMIVYKLRRGEKFTPFADQYSTPIYTETVGKLIQGLLEKGEQGIYHLVTDKAMSKFDFADLVAQEFLLDKNLLEAKSVQGVNFRAPRPIRSDLNNNKVLKALGLENLAVEADLKAMHNQEELYGQYKKAGKKG